MKKPLALLMAALMSFGILTACNVAQDPAVVNGEPSISADPAPAPVNAAPVDEADRSTPVAKINGETVLTLGELTDMFNMYSEYFAAYGYDVKSDEATLHTFQDDLVDMIVLDKLVAVKAKELGYANYSPEQQEELDNRVDEEIVALHEYYTGLAQDEAATDPSISVVDRAMELILEQAVAETNDENITYEDYCAKLKETIELQYLAEIMQADLTKDIAATDEDIHADFDQGCAEHIETYTANPSYYKDDQEGYEISLEGVPPLFVPDNYHRMMDIFIPFDGAIPVECTDAQTAMNNARSEYCTLAFEDALNNTNANSAAMETALAAYRSAQAIYDEKYAEYTAAARETIAAAYSRLENGESFAAVMNDVTENTDFTEIPAFTDKGMLISTEYSSGDDWSDTIKAEFAKLALGQYSPVFEDSDGMHIIYYLSDEKPGTKDVDEVHDAIATSLTQFKRDEYWGTLIDEWKNDGSVELMTDIYRQLGK